MDELIAYLEEEGFSLSSPLRSQGPVIFQGLLNLQGKSFLLELRFLSRHYDYPDTFLIEYPFDSLLRNELGFRHINKNGKICHTDESQSWWDSANAVRLTAGVLEKVKKILNDNLSETLDYEYFFRDFAGYWAAKEELYLSSFPHNTLKYNKIKELSSDRQWLVNPQSPPKWLKKDSIELDCSWLTFHLKSPPLPKTETWPPLRFKDLESWLKASEPNAPMYLLNMLKRFVFNKRKDKQSGYSEEVGILFTWSENGKENLLGGAVKFKVPEVSAQAIANNRIKNAIKSLALVNPVLIRYSVTRADPAYIQERNLPFNTPTLKDKTIVLIGAGAIGGHLSHLLCSQGAGWGRKGKLHIVDFDFLSTENIGRHFLGMEFVGYSKVNALVIALNKSFPHLTLVPHHDRIYNKWELIDKADLIIDATGSQTTAISLADYMSNLKDKPPIFHSWIQGHGIATGVLLKSDKSHACYRCLWQLENNKYIPRYKLAKNLESNLPVFVGCHKSYYPYVASTAITAAIQVSQMISDYLSGTIKNNLRFNILNKKECYNRPDTHAQVLKECPFCSRQSS